MTEPLLICPMAGQCAAEYCRHSRPHPDYGNDSCGSAECTEGVCGPCVPYAAPDSAQGGDTEATP